MQKKIMWDVFIAVLAVMILIGYSVSAQTVVFDDFSYTSANDPAIESFNKWTIVNGTNGPPSNATYQKSNVTFAEGIMELKCSNSGTPASARHARLEGKEVVYFEGTYAARVFFDNSPRDNNDPVIQTFYAISPYSGGQNPATYAEVDFEYLPYDAWNGLYTDNYDNAMWMSSYESAKVLPNGLDNDHEFLKEDFGGQWYTLLFRFTDGVHVEYFIDGELKATLSKRQSDGVSVYPDYNMLVSFANWAYPPIEGSTFGNSTAFRSSTMKVDWFVHVKDENKTTAEIENIVEGFRSRGVDRRNFAGQEHRAIATSIEDDAYRPDVFPNPCKSFITVKNLPARTTATINDVYGKMVARSCVFRDNRLDVHYLKPGGYILTLELPNGKVVRRHLQKQ